MDIPVPELLAQAASAAAAIVPGAWVDAIRGPLADAARSAVADAASGPLADVASRLDTTQLLAVAAALGWASGLRLYLVVFLTGLAGRLGWVPLPSGLHLLESNAVLAAAGLMLVLEFLADKVPVVDSIWDALHTFIRIPAGAALAAGALGADGGSWQLAAALMGGTLAATSHVAKASTRAAANTSPEPFSNIALSLAGDAAVPGALWLSWAHPMVFLILLVPVLLFMLVLIVLLWRFVRRLAARWRGGSAYRHVTETGN